MGKLIESFYISRFCFFSFHRWSQQEKEEENRGDRKHFLRSLCLATYGTTWKSYRYGSWGARIASAEWIAGNATKLIRDNCIVIFFSVIVTWKLLVFLGVANRDTQFASSTEQPTNLSSDAEFTFANSRY